MHAGTLLQPPHELAAPLRASSVALRPLSPPLLRPATHRAVSASWLDRRTRLFCSHCPAQDLRHLPSRTVQDAAWPCSLPAVLCRGEDEERLSAARSKLLCRDPTIIRDDESRVYEGSRSREVQNGQQHRPAHPRPARATAPAATRYDGFEGHASELYRPSRNSEKPATQNPFLIDTVSSSFLLLCPACPSAVALLRRLDRVDNARRLARPKTHVEERALCEPQWLRGGQAEEAAAPEAAVCS